MRRSAGIPFYVVPALLTILLAAGLPSVWFICPRGPSPYEIYRDSLDFTPPVPLTFLPDSLTDGNIDCFFEDWREWSRRLRSHCRADRCTELFEAAFRSAPHPDSAEFIVLPALVEHCSHSGHPPAGGFFINDTKNILGGRTFIPFLTEPDREVLYMTNEIKALISNYLGGVTQKKGNRSGRYFDDPDESRAERLSRRIPVRYGHWGGHWHLCTMPIVSSVETYQDGDAVAIRTSASSGTALYYPADTAAAPPPGIPEGTGVDLGRWIE